MWRLNRAPYLRSTWMSERQARAWALALTSAAFLMVTLDALVVVTALPAIQIGRAHV